MYSCYFTDLCDVNMTIVSILDNDESLIVLTLYTNNLLIALNSKL